MKMISLKCPECDAPLSIDDGLDTFYCQYCGAKIQLHEQTEAAYKARTRVKQMEHQERLKQMKYEKEREEREQNQKELPWLFVFSIVVLLLMTLPLILWGGNI